MSGILRHIHHGFYRQPIVQILDILNEVMIQLLFIHSIAFQSHHKFIQLVIFPNKSVLLNDIHPLPTNLPLLPMQQTPIIHRIQMNTLLLLFPLLQTILRIHLLVLMMGFVVHRIYLILQQHNQIIVNLTV